MNSGSGSGTHCNDDLNKNNVITAQPYLHGFGRYLGVRRMYTVCTYIRAYILSHTHTHTHTQSLSFPLCLSVSLSIFASIYPNPLSDERIKRNKRVEAVERSN